MHPHGFGLHHFKQELTGPEYAGRFISMLKDTSIKVLSNAMVLQITADHQVHTVSAEHGYQVLQGKAIVLAMGCRERTRGAIAIPGDRPAGVFTAGTAQRYLNMEGYMVGKRVLILGSGDIGLIMARRMTLEGAEVLACVELMPYSGGLKRNIVQCLEDFDIPLYLSHTITHIKAENGRVCQATVAQVDESRCPIPGTERIFECDTVLLSVGLIPENEISREAGICMDPRTGGAVVYENMETSLPGIFACGNVVHVHDLVDFVTAESQKAGSAGAAYVKNTAPSDGSTVTVHNGTGVSYTVPQKIRTGRIDKTVSIFFRVVRPCEQCHLTVSCGNEVLATFKRDRVAPGEMERLTLTKDVLEKSDGTITLSVTEVSQ